MRPSSSARIACMETPGKSGLFEFYQAEGVGQCGSGDEIEKNSPEPAPCGGAGALRMRLILRLRLRLLGWSLRLLRSGRRRRWLLLLLLLLLELLLLRRRSNFRL